MKVKKLNSILKTSGIERDDAEVSLHTERHARFVARIGEDRHDVLADLARRQRRAETGEKGLEADAPIMAVASCVMMGTMQESKAAYFPNYYSYYQYYLNVYY